MRKILILCLLLLLCGCSNTNNEEVSESTTKEMFTERDLDDSYDEQNAISIILDENTIECSASSVKIENSVITLTEDTTYIIQGSLADGQIVIDMDEQAKPQLVLDDVSIKSSTSAPIYILEADKVFITLKEGSENVVANENDFTDVEENHVDGVIFSKQDITFNGNGKLNISSFNGHGIVGKDDVVFTGGTYTIQSASHGLDANDSIRLTNSKITIVSGKDGMHVENEEDSSLGFLYIKDGEYKITSEGDGLSASTNVEIIDGDFDILSGGGSENGTKQTSDMYGQHMGNRPGERRPDMNYEESVSTQEDSTSIKGIKASNLLVVHDGSFNINSADDAIHANSSITIHKGEYIIQTGDDGFHADDTLTIQGGDITIKESYEGLEALNVYIYDGEINLVAEDDGINAAGGNDTNGNEGPRGKDHFKGNGNSDGCIEIHGGTISIEAYGDGIDANGTLAIYDGYIHVFGPTTGDTATLDYDTSATITGGTFIGTGASNMAQTFSDSKQGVFAIRVGNVRANTSFTIVDENNTEILTHTPTLDYSVIIVSTPKMQKGEVYTIIVGESSGSFEAY